MEGLRFTMRAVCLSVVAVSLAVGSIPSAVGQAPLATPAAPTLSNNSSTGGLNVTIHTVPSATSYAITIRNDKTNFKQTQTVIPPNPAATSFATQTAALEANSGYVVSVQAQNSTSASAASPAVSIVTLPAPPTNITGLGGLEKVTVSWTAAPGATSYQLTLSNGMSFTTTATSYTVTGLQTATSYNVIVASRNSAGQGTFSPAVVVRTANVALQ